MSLFYPEQERRDLLRCRFAFACLIAIALATVPGIAADRIFLLGGQSNMAGCGYVSELIGSLEAYTEPLPAVCFWQISSGSWIALRPGLGANENEFGPELAFGHAMHQALPGDTIYVIKYAVGGSMLGDNMDNPAHMSGTWKPGVTTTNPTRCYPTFKAVVREALATLGKDNAQIAAMLWMQGESDAYTFTDAAAYSVNLTELIATVRSDVAVPELPFVLGQITTFYGDAENNALVRANQVAAAEADPNVYCFSTDDLEVMDGANGGHYNTQGQIDLGVRFADVCAELPFPEPSTLLPNGGFETGDFLYWRAYTTGSNTIEVTAAPENVHNGLYAAQLTLNDFDNRVFLDNAYNTYSLEPGYRYAVYFSLKKISGDADSYVHLNASLTGPEPSYRVVEQDLRPGTDYIRCSHEFVIPVNATNHSLYLWYEIHDTSSSGGTASYAIDHIGVNQLQPRGSMMILQ